MAEGKDLEALRHSTSHIMAEAVCKLFPGTKLAIGPPIQDGFYYDFDTKEPFTLEDIEKITEKMREIIKRDSPFVKKEMSKSEAMKFFEERGEKYKVELIKELPGDSVSLYYSGDFVDLCKGPHVKSTGEVKHFRLLEIAGAYWRGDENREMLQRIYGTVFHTKDELEAYLHRLEEAKKRDHRKLGKELDLFSIHEEAGPGLIFWHPKGSIIRKIIEDFWRDEHLKNGYQLINIPHIAKIDLWKKSGHWDFYREYMYSPMNIEGQQYILKPMNCPGHILIYKTKLRSYRDLPIRWAELGTVYRYERSGVLHGLLRVRGFTQDDAHIFCRKDQLEEELIKVIDFVIVILKTFGFKEYEVKLSTRPEKCVGTIENWERATDALKKALERAKLNYEVDPGEGVFYGPKADIKIKDSLLRSWQCSTVQVDFNIPERFGMTFINRDNSKERPIMIHRALMGSLERFFGVLIEHYGGHFPLWLAPIQVRVMTITDKGVPYSKEVSGRLQKSNVRVDLDIDNVKIGKKIRDAQLEKIPYMLILGEKEMIEGSVSVRRRSEDMGKMSLAEFIGSIGREVEERR